MKFILRILTALVFSSVAALAQSGSPTKQSGNVTPTHAACWTTNGIIQDCGTAAIPYLTTIGTVGQGPTICANSGPVTGPYDRVCLTATNGTGGGFTFDNIGGGTGPFMFKVNGTTYQFPYTVGGIVGPVSSTSGDVACWNNSSGSLLADCGTQRTRLIPAVVTYFYVNGSDSSTAPCGPTGVLTCQPGSDSNNGHTNTTPFLHAQHAVDILNFNIDQAGGEAIVSLAHAAQGSAAAANYSLECAAGSVVGNVEITLQGDTTDQNAVHITAPNGSNAIFVKDLCIMSLEYIAIDDQGSAAGAIAAGQDSVVDLQHITFGAFNSGAAILQAFDAGANVNWLGPCTINGGAGVFVSAQGAAKINFNGQQCTIATAQAFNIFAYISGFVEGVNGSTFMGAGVSATTGTRGLLFGSGFLAASAVSCNSVFPGNVACQLTNFSSDDANDPLTMPPTLNGPPLALQTYAIAGLPTCNSGTQGRLAYVSNGVASPSYNATVSTTGAALQMVWCNSANWTYH